MHAVSQSDCPAGSLSQGLMYLSATIMVILLHACVHTANLLFVHHYPASPPRLLGGWRVSHHTACCVTQHIHTPCPVMRRAVMSLGVRPTTSPSTICSCLFCSMSTLLALSCSEKLDVEDHYVAWRQTHDQPQHQFGLDGPFSFCSYPFLLNPRAKSKLLHTEARFLMTQVTTSPHHTMAVFFVSNA